MSSLDGLVIIVAGGAGGVGSVTSKILADRGAKVVVADINDQRATKVANEITQAGGSAVAYHLDLAKEESVRDVIEKSAQNFGQIDGLVNMAAQTRPDIINKDGPVDNMSPDVWRETMDVNLIGFALTTKYTLPHFLKNSGGSIVNISSGAAHAGEPTRPAYGASKAAIHALTRHTARKWGPQGIRANALMIGLIATEQVKELYANQPYLQEAIKSCPLQRMAEPKEIATVVAFLLSTDSSYVTGQAWAIDGGYQFRD
ncbi:short-chain dehydrogenase reductase sdr [Colletotrichum karsti]|uniref:Short-chain dehydrogenase reductase sdr n=1 Tax=Colletotrichum karsti TaxID=1095194 RepID=A0A9P6LLY0_9PEZI|nr:short-chain dehydrogenase reductase sdr [Colletotrichum karsti]KAF9877022.1 short-chain dehydrogenase reductase sdr [Colletotrichum karsti]